MVPAKVLLIQPNYKGVREFKTRDVSPPLGLAYIAAVLEKNKVPVDIIDADALDLSVEQLAKEIEIRKPTIVGVTMLTPGHNFSVELVKKIPKGMMKIAGGAHASAVPEELCKEGYDVVVKGEGERTMLELVGGVPFDKIKGVVYMKDGIVKHTASREPLDPNELPLPARHLLPSNGVDLPYRSLANFYKPWAGVLTSRGCPFNCYYCNKNIFSRSFRPRSPENVVDEIEFLVREYGVKEIDILDDCFNLDLERAEKILDMIVEKGLKIHIRAANGLRADMITERFVKKFKKAGGCYIALGIESGDQKILDSIPKQLKLEQIRKAVKIIKKERIFLTGFFILGLMGDTEESMNKTIEFAKELDLDVASFNIATPIPGTRFYDEVKAKGKLLFDSWDKFTMKSGVMTYTMEGTAPPEVVEALYKKAHRTFYFRPSYVLKQIVTVRSLDQIRTILRGLTGILTITRGEE